MSLTFTYTGTGTINLSDENGALKISEADKSFKLYPSDIIIEEKYIKSYSSVFLSDAVFPLARFWLSGNNIITWDQTTTPVCSDNSAFGFSYLPAFHDFVNLIKFQKDRVTATMLFCGCMSATSDVTIINNQRINFLKDLSFDKSWYDTSTNKRAPTVLSAQMTKVPFTHSFGNITYDSTTKVFKVEQSKNLPSDGYYVIGAKLSWVS